MTDISLIFFISFFINLLYELLHSVLYKTCHEAPLQKYIYLILKGAIFDGVAITVIYVMSALILPADIQMPVFFAVALLFAFGWEKLSLAAGKWEYTKDMPTVFGVGITPLIQLAVTGFLSIYLTFYLSFHI